MKQIQFIKQNKFQSLSQYLHKIQTHQLVLQQRLSKNLILPDKIILIPMNQIQLYYKHNNMLLFSQISCMNNYNLFFSFIKQILFTLITLQRLSIKIPNLSLEQVFIDSFNQPYIKLLSDDLNQQFSYFNFTNNLELTFDEVQCAKFNENVIQFFQLLVKQFFEQNISNAIHQFAQHSTSTAQIFSIVCYIEILYQKSQINKIFLVRNVQFFNSLNMFQSYFTKQVSMFVKTEFFISLIYHIQINSLLSKQLQIDIKQETLQDCNKYQQLISVGQQSFTKPQVIQYSEQIENKIIIITSTEYQIQILENQIHSFYKKIHTDYVVINVTSCKELIQQIIQFQCQQDFQTIYSNEIDIDELFIQHLLQQDTQESHQLQVLLNLDELTTQQKQQYDEFALLGQNLFVDQLFNGYNAVKELDPNITIPTQFSKFITNQYLSSNQQYQKYGILQYLRTIIYPQIKIILIINQQRISLDAFPEIKQIIKSYKYLNTQNTVMILIDKNIQQMDKKTNLKSLQKYILKQNIMKFSLNLIDDILCFSPHKALTEMYNKSILNNNLLQISDSIEFQMSNNKFDMYQIYFQFIISSGCYQTINIIQDQQIQSAINLASKQLGWYQDYFAFNYINQSKFEEILLEYRLAREMSISPIDILYIFNVKSQLISIEQLQKYTQVSQEYLFTQLEQLTYQRLLNKISTNKYVISDIQMGTKILYYCSYRDQSYISNILFWDLISRYQIIQTFSQSEQIYSEELLSQLSRMYYCILQTKSCTIAQHKVEAEQLQLERSSFNDPSFSLVNTMDEIFQMSLQDISSSSSEDSFHSFQFQIQSPMTPQDITLYEKNRKAKRKVISYLIKIKVCLMFVATINQSTQVQNIFLQLSQILITTQYYINEAKALCDSNKEQNYYKQLINLETSCILYYFLFSNQPSSIILLSELNNRNLTITQYTLIAWRLINLQKINEANKYILSILKSHDESYNFIDKILSYRVIFDKFQEQTLNVNEYIFIVNLVQEYNNITIIDTLNDKVKFVLLLELLLLVYLLTDQQQSLLSTALLIIQIHVQYKFKTIISDVSIYIMQVNLQKYLTHTREKYYLMTQLLRISIDQLNLKLIQNYQTNLRSDEIFNTQYIMKQADNIIFINQLLQSTPKFVIYFINFEDKLPNYTTQLHMSFFDYQHHIRVQNISNVFGYYLTLNSEKTKYYLLSLLNENEVLEQIIKKIIQNIYDEQQNIYFDNNVISLIIEKLNQNFYSGNVVYAQHLYSIIKIYMTLTQQSKYNQFKLLHDKIQHYEDKSYKFWDNNQYDVQFLQNQQNLSLEQYESMFYNNNYLSMLTRQYYTVCLNRALKDANPYVEADNYIPFINYWCQ
uniref:Uncharacterized protein n=1 Tax=Spironucleus salmonicida TaxID=348837 RepID=V6LX26_9EUKA|eukprot:EST48261.1 Hypothetical protein SS50377_fx094 [Spironucleus salmonicida]